MDIEFDEDGTATCDGWTMDITDSVIECRCGETLEPDAHSCSECGSLNPFRKAGLI